VFCLIRAAHKIGFKVSYNLNTGGDQWKVIETYVFDKTSIFLCKLCLVIRYLPPAMSRSELYSAVVINECP